jgi:hypothetical protein
MKKLVKESLGDVLKPKSREQILSDVGGRDEATFEKTDKSPSGTHLVGEIETSFNTLVDLFGMPNFEGDGDKVTVEWVLEDDQGNKFTIYDWKMYGIDVTKLPSYSWHIGGTTDPSDLKRYIFKNTI